MRPLAARRVDVHARDARRRKAVREKALHLLRPEPALPQHDAFAARALRPLRFRMLAVVADEPLGRAMVREADRTVRTRRDVATLRALDKCRVAAAVEKQNCLFL